MKTLYASTTIHKERWSGPKRYIRIAIHETPEDLRKAAHRYNGADFEETVGCFQPCQQRFLISKKSKDPIPLTKSYAGIMRFAEGYMTSEIMAHESVHAAAHIYRMDCHDIVNLGDTCNYREEMLAYIVGDLVLNIDNSLHAAGYIKYHAQNVV